MKNITLLIAVVSWVVFSNEMAFGNDAVSAAPATKSPKQISPAIVAHKPITANEAPNQVKEKAKNVQLRNVPLASPPKSNLPINVGQQHGPAAIGGSNPGNKTKIGAINGTEIKRHL